MSTIPKFIKIKADEHRSPFPKGDTYVSVDDIAGISGITDNLVGPEFSIIFKQGGTITLLGKRLRKRIGEYIERNCDVIELDIAGER